MQGKKHFRCKENISVLSVEQEGFAFFPRNPSSRVDQLTSNDNSSESESIHINVWIRLVLFPYSNFQVQLLLAALSRILLLLAFGYIKMNSLLFIPFLCVVIFFSVAVTSENAIFTNEEYPGSGLILVPGVDLVLFCNYTDRPAAVFDWFKDGSPLDRGPTSRYHFEPPTNNILKIKDSEDGDCGNYSCVSSDVYAIIPVRSVVKIAPLDNSRNVVQGQNIVLVCNATQGRPFPVLKWYKDEQELNISDPRVTLTKDNHTNIEGTTLTIVNANFDDRAEYTCNATNEISSANMTILVRVKDKYAALWPFLGICAEVAVLCTIIFIYEKRRQKADFDESETEHNTENKNVADQEDKSRDVRQRK